LLGFYQFEPVLGKLRGEIRGETEHGITLKA